MLAIYKHGILLRKTTNSFECEGVLIMGNWVYI
jgi:hypothetical protein